jgi:hypothetical protein
MITFVIVFLVVGHHLFAGKVHDPSEDLEELAKWKASCEAEETVIESASWIGTTGLPESVERELPKYLRREFGERLLDRGSLRASDLEYVGVFPQTHGQTHFWRIAKQKEPCFATVVAQNDGSFCTGWGGEGPDSDI